MRLQSDFHPNSVGRPSGASVLEGCHEVLQSWLWRLALITHCHQLADRSFSFRGRQVPLCASVVRHTDGHLFSTARARVTFSRMSVALAVQMKGLGF